MNAFHKNIAVWATVFFVFLISCKQETLEQEFTVGEPEVVMTFEQMRSQGIGWMDTGMFGLNDNGRWKWFVGEGRHGQSVGMGPKDNPFGEVFAKEVFVQGIPDSHPDSLGWNEIRDHANSHWISNVYQDPETGHILAFLHIEHIYTWPGYPAYHRSGLSISRDGGKSYQWCGYIISPDLSYETWINHWYPENESCNMGLSNYILKDGYFYIYYTDYVDQPDPSKSEEMRGLAVVRAPVQEVLDSARNQSVPEWKKYHHGTWTEKALGGDFTPLNIVPHGTTHGDAAYNAYLDKYVLVSRRYSDLSIVVAFSEDGLTWGDWQVVHESDRPQQYLSIVSTGDDNEVLGESFWIYYRWRREESGFDWARVKVVLE
jgi:hypothetical protein